jgi:hypothetical protein
VGRFFVPPAQKLKKATINHTELSILDDIFYKFLLFNGSVSYAFSMYNSLTWDGKQLRGATNKVLERSGRLKFEDSAVELKGSY